jgi:hypothetical protein
MVTRLAAAVARPGRTAADGGSAAAALLDRGHELALPHPTRAGYAERLSEPLELGQQHAAGPRTSAAARPGRRGLTGLAAGVRPGACGVRPVRGSPC